MTDWGADAGRMGREPEGFQVEFVPVDPLDEDVFDQRPGGLLHTSSRRWLAGALAVAALGGALAGRAATQSGSAPRPVTVTVPVRVPPDVIGLYHDMSVPVGPPTPAFPPCADAGGRCDVSKDLPGPFVQAVRQWIDLKVMTAQTDVTVGGRDVLYRELRGLAADGAAVEVSVAGTDSLAGAGWGTERFADRTEAWVTHPAGAGLLVKVVMTGRSPWRPPRAEMAALAADPRLLLPG